MWWLFAILPSTVLALFVCGKPREAAYIKSEDRKICSNKIGISEKSSKSAKERSTKSRKKIERSGRSSKSNSGRSSKESSNSKKSSKSESSRRNCGGLTTSEKSLRKIKSISPDNKRNKVNISIKADKKAAELATTQSTSTLAKCAKNSTAVQPVTIQAPITNMNVECFDLHIEPSELTYRTIGGLKNVNVINNTQERKAFKIKCSDNLLYRVNPVYGIVEPGMSAKVGILRQNGGRKIDKVVIITAKAEESDREARDIFIRTANQHHEMMVLPLLVEE